MAEVPVELITEILERLPVKTLLRFRYICKSIRDIIDSRNYINSHLKTTSDDRTHRKLISRGGFPDDIFVVFDIDDSSLQCFYNFDFQPELEILSDYEFFGHCNGLVLLGRDFYHLHLWNPSTRKYKRLPPLQSTGIESIIDFGFGYDSSTDDYKVLLIKSVFTEEYLRDFEHDEIWVLGLRSCYWRMIGKDLVPHDHRYSIDLTNCFVDGAFHFSRDGGKVFAFDLADETFSQRGCILLHVFEGCLCTSLFPFNKRKDIEYYVREKDGVGFSWTKLSLSFSRKKYRWQLLAYSKERGKVFMLDDRRRLLYSYHLREKSFNKIEIEEIVNPHGIFYIESLVPVDYEQAETKKK